MTCGREAAALAIKGHKTDKALSASERKKLVDAIRVGLKTRRKDLNPKNIKKATRWDGLPRGSHIAMKTKLNGGLYVSNTYITLRMSFAGKVLLACAWADKTNKNSIGTSGHILPGKPIKRVTYKAIPSLTGPPTQDVRTR